jgi:hypothetical protein
VDSYLNSQGLNLAGTLNIRLAGLGVMLTHHNMVRAQNNIGCQAGPVSKEEEGDFERHRSSTVQYCTIFNLCFFLNSGNI